MKTARAMPGRNRRRAFGAACVLAFAFAAAHAQNIPGPKLDLIRQATAAMKLDQRIQGLVHQRVDADMQALRLDNPGMPDSVAREARAVIAGVYAANLEGRDGLMPRVYAVLDRHLTEDDLRFASDFRGSDQGRRYRERVPRVVAESLEAGRAWAESLRPEIRRRLETVLRAMNNEQ